jgi:hypothetical protein
MKQRAYDNWVERFYEAEISGQGKAGILRFISSSLYKRQ